MPGEFKHAKASDPLRVVRARVGPAFLEYVDCEYKTSTSMYDSGGVGALDVLTMDEVADIVMEEIAHCTEEQRMQSSIIVTMLSHERVPGTWSQRTITNVSSHWGRGAITLFYDPALAAMEEEGEHSDGDHGGDEGGNSNDEFDFATLPKPKRLPATAHLFESAALLDLLPSGENEEDAYRTDDDDEENVYRTDAEEIDSSDDESSANLDAQVALVPEIKIDSPFQKIHSRVGVYEKDGGTIYLLDNTRLGRIEWIHGSSLSVKAICENHAHEPPDAVEKNVTCCCMQRFLRSKDMNKPCCG